MPDQFRSCIALARIRFVRVVSAALLLALMARTAIVWAGSDAGSIAMTGSLAAPAAAASALPSGDGSVLVFGDTGGAAPEVYDSAAGVFLPVSAVHGVRTRAGGALLDDGRILLVGGLNGSQPLDTAVIFDPATRAFSTVGARMTTARVDPRVTRLLDGRVLVAGGGQAEFAATAEIFDPAAGTFSAAGTASAFRLGPATVLGNGRVLFTGGETPDGAGANTAEIFDPSSLSFAAAAPMMMARHGHQASLLPDGRVLVTGGYGIDGVPTGSAEIFDPADETFRDAGGMISARADHRTVQLASGEILVIGGRDAAGAVASAEVYSPDAAAFTSAGELHEPRWSPAVALLADGRVLVAGGRSNAGVLASAEVYGVYARPAPKFETFTTLLPATATVTYGQSVSYSARVTSGHGIPAGDVQFVDNGATVLATATLDGSGVARATVTGVTAGLHSITASYTGSRVFTASVSAPVPQAVAQGKATGTLTESPLQRQYSDRVILDATITPAFAAQSVTFKIGTQVLGTAPIVAGRAHLEPQLLGVVPPGVRIVSAVFNQLYPNYVINSPTRSMTVLREDARVAYTGSRTVNSGCGSCSTAVVHLEATVTDISAASPATDPDPGDVETANVSFINRATGAVIQTVPVYASSPDHRVGKARYDWPYSLGKSSSQVLTIGMIVGNQYVRSSSTDDAKVSVNKK